MQRAWKIEMLGGLQAIQGDRVIARFATQRAASLLAFLALNPGRARTREELVELLWPDVDPAVSRLRLNQVLSSLRRQFGQTGRHQEGLILADRWSVSLQSPLVTTDVSEFERAAKGTDLTTLEHAVALYTGELLPGTYDEWVLSERNRLLTLYASVLNRLLVAYQEARRWEDAVTIANKLVDLDPFSEPAHCSLIHLYGVQGLNAAALAQFEQLRIRLQEIQESPSPAADDLIQAIQSGSLLRTTPEVRTSIPTEPRAVAKGATNLPIPLARFFGREDDLEALLALFSRQENRLITLMGPGGVGKTRLAVEVGHQLHEIFGESIWFVPLADVAEPGSVVDAILEALGARPSQDQKGIEAIASALPANDPSLLILDNMEHVLEAVPAIGEMLQRLPKLFVLATSRSALQLSGEHRFVLEPLGIPSQSSTPENFAAYPSVQLFLDRARSVRVDFAITKQNSQAVGAICSRLEGLPLALELAAGWSATMSPSQILQGLDQSFDLLKSRRRDVPMRHRSLEATIDYGFSQLRSSSQELLLTLSVFQGGFNESSIKEFYPNSEVGALLVDLTERSMIQAKEAVTGSVRFSLLETLRQYLLGRLDEEQLTRLRETHAQTFLKLAAEAAKDRFGPRQALILAHLSENHYNLLAALDWLQASNPTDAIQMASYLDWYWEAKGHLRIGRHYLLDNLETPNIPAAIRGAALNSLAWIAWYQADLELAAHLGEEARTIFSQLGDSVGLQNAAYNLGVTAFKQKRFGEARVRLSEALQLAEAEQDEPGISRALMMFGSIYRLENDPSQSKDYYHRSLQLEQKLGNTMRACFALSNLGGVAEDEHEYDLAVQCYARCVALAQETGHHSYEGVFRYNLGNAKVRSGRLAEAREDFRAALSILRASKQDHVAFRLIWDLAKLASDENDLGAKATLWGILASVVTRIHSEPDEAAQLVKSEQESVADEERLSSEYITARAMALCMGPQEADRFIFDWISAEKGA